MEGSGRMGRHPVAGLGDPQQFFPSYGITLGFRQLPRPVCKAAPDLGSGLHGDNDAIEKRRLLEFFRIRAIQTRQPVLRVLLYPQESLLEHLLTIGNGVADMPPLLPGGIDNAIRPFGAVEIHQFAYLGQRRVVIERAGPPQQVPSITTPIGHDFIPNDPFLFFGDGHRIAFPRGKYVQSVTQPGIALYGQRATVRLVVEPAHNQLVFKDLNRHLATNCGKGLGPAKHYLLALGFLQGLHLDVFSTDRRNPFWPEIILSQPFHSLRRPRRQNILQRRILNKLL